MVNSDYNHKMTFFSMNLLNYRKKQRICFDSQGHPVKASSAKYAEFISNAEYLTNAAVYVYYILIEMIVLFMHYILLSF